MLMGQIVTLVQRKDNFISGVDNLNALSYQVQLEPVYPLRGVFVVEYCIKTVKNHITVIRSIARARLSKDW